MFLSLGLDCNMILGAQCLWNEYREVVLHPSNANKHPYSPDKSATYLWAHHSSLEKYASK